ncbi:hypothetical protein PG993_011896 [Apiospora rasikravindrae]|uniref:Uncharacterized protein n=1 Tax=Apiospora rasikravindrae TaxID=990691 RepID=A0ABR1S0Z8_9PEZI
MRGVARPQPGQDTLSVCGAVGLPFLVISAYGDTIQGKGAHQRGPLEVDVGGGHDALRRVLMQLRARDAEEATDEAEARCCQALGRLGSVGLRGLGHVDESGEGFSVVGDDALAVMRQRR